MNIKPLLAICSIVLCLLVVKCAYEWSNSMSLDETRQQVEGRFG